MGKLHHVQKCILVFIVIIVHSSTVSARTLNIAFLNARTNVGFWKTVEDFMIEVAKDFDDIKLTIYRAESDHYAQMDILKEITSPNYKTRYDAVLTRTLKSNGLKLLEIAEKNKVPIFLFNSGLTEEQIAEIGGPRQTYHYFIGEMYPDDEKAGFDLAKEIYDTARKNNIIGREQGAKTGIIALGGGPTNNASVARLNGLKRFVDENNDKLELLQVFEIDVVGDDGVHYSKVITPLIQRRYKGTNLFWGYNDGVAVGLTKAFEANDFYGLTPGTSFLCGGIDWTPEALELVANGKMVCSLGGHYMDGGWALIMLYDYFNGKDFKQTEGITSFSTSLSVIDKATLPGYRKLFVDNHVNQIDFTQFSKARNPALKRYEFGLKIMLNQMTMKE